MVCSCDLLNGVVPSEFVFPNDFLWGAATSAHQVEGNNIHSDWWAWEAAGRVKERSGLACDHYRRYAEDLDVTASLGHTAHRFSIEWARIEPDAGTWDDAALAHYVDVVRALRQRRLEPVVTLHHFTSPQWLASSGGWTNPLAVDRFARYVRKVVEALGDSVRYWITINEPMVFVRMHYLQGLGPPGMQHLSHAIQALEHVIRAHAAAYRVIHDALRASPCQPQVSVAHHYPAFASCRRWAPLDRWITCLTDRAFNAALLDVLTEGRWSVPGVARWRIPEARASADFLGVNFYGRQFLRWHPVAGQWPGAACDLGHHPREVTERTALGWDVHPNSLYEALRRLQRWNLPVLITENGAYMIDDAQRWSYLRRHIQAMARAMQAGAAVIGYCCWSLLDNFEWAEGYGPRFGIVEVDYASQRRTIRDSGRRYGEICRANRIDLHS